MGLIYQSTGGGEKEVTASTAVLQGPTKDDSLSMPSGILELNMSSEKLASMTYQEAVYEVVKLFLIDYTEAELKDCIARAYNSKFDIEEIVPLAKADEAYYLELYHGSAITFKDMALSILPHLITTATRKSHVGRGIVILTATSEDTGKAATAGSADVPGIQIIVFYPKDGVSEVQELQMRTQREGNTSVVAIRGNFDSAQTGVKKIFGDRDPEAELAGKGFRLSSANSINIGRLVPQIVYYVHVYTKLLEAGEIDKGEKISVVVPTGSFDNILVTYSAKRMGPPIKTLVYASSDNKALYSFFTTRIYDREREFILTNSSSVDILISNDLERLIYLNTGCDIRASAALMRRLSEEGRYEVTPEMHVFMSDFTGGFTTQKQDAATIRRLFDGTGYLTDTHTDVAATVYMNYRRENGNGTKTVITSTTSPYKFSHNVIEAIAGREKLEGKDEFRIVSILGVLSGVAVPQAVEEIHHAAARRDREYGVDDMKDGVKDILGIS